MATRTQGQIWYGATESPRINCWEKICLGKLMWRPLCYVLGTTQALSLEFGLSCVVDLPVPILVPGLAYLNCLDFEPINVCMNYCLVWLALDCGWPWLPQPDTLCFFLGSVGQTLCWWGPYSATMLVPPAPDSTSLTGQHTVALLYEILH